MKPLSVKIYGTGLIGTSIGLRAAELAWPISLIDSADGPLQIAKDLIPSNREIAEPDLIVIATTPNAAITLIPKIAESHPAATVIDVSSIKAKVQVKVSELSDLDKRFVGTHPIAGREKNGPQAARSDLFMGRAWVLTPSENVDSWRLETVTQFISAMGATPYQMSTKLHDALFAKISHLPQLISVALASSISELGPEISLAGQGLRDMLRLASSDGSLWSEIILDNKDEVLASIDDFQELLDVLRDSIEDEDGVRIKEMFDDANFVPEKVGGKHGMKRREYTFVDVVIDDKPGQLASLFDECGSIKVNIEDLSLEHSPQQETGLIRLALSSNDAELLFKHLLARGWKAHKQ